MKVQAPVLEPDHFAIPAHSRRSVTAFLQLKKEQLAKLEEALHSKASLQEGLRPPELVAKRLEIPRLTAVRYLEVIDNLSRQRSRLTDVDESALRKDLENLAGRTLDETSYQIILRLLADDDEQKLVDKAEDLRLALLPHYVDARTVCDVRPVFDKAREKIEFAVVTVALELTSHCGLEKPKTTVVLLDDDDINTLIQKLNEAKAKIAAIRSQFGAVEIYR